MVEIGISNAMTQKMEIHNLGKVYTQFMITSLPRKTDLYCVKNDLLYYWTSSFSGLINSYILESTKP